jgi:hypothetical protein
MKYLTIALVIFAVLAAGGQAVAQTQMTSVGTNYGSNVTKISPIDQDHWVGTQEITGIRLDDSGKGPFHLMTTHIVLILYGDKSGVRLHGYSTFMDKDGDKVMADLSEASLTSPKGKGKVLGGTGKFAGIEGTVDYEVSNPKGFPEGTDRTICREVWKLTLKTPL